MAGLAVEHKKHISAVILAAGSGRRIGGDIRKQYIELKGRPLICRTVDVFEKYSEIDDIILVVPADDKEYVKKEIVQRYGFTKVRAVVDGGSERYFSVAKGLEYIRKGLSDKADTSAELVMIHDGARPFVNEAVLGRICEAFESSLTRKDVFAAVVSVKAKDTLKYADDDGYVLKSLDRDHIYVMQTPQAFSLSVIDEAYKKLLSEMNRSDESINITDDAMVLERYFPQYKIRLIEGSYDNFKITTAEDISYAEFVLNTAKKSC